MSAAHLQLVDKRTKKLRELLTELNESQGSIREQLEFENKNFERLHGGGIRSSELKRVATAMALVPRYQKKTIELSKRMKALSQRIFKMKQRARELLEMQRKASESNA
eukprot:CAMPEP_0185254566 /NCGR_PEP_ID=MMETSP1359-20130426/3416_1 /TAXON_ID=552665 /ORGANISM="Bigelowiella longifila, Strain CCMP242" /LENGTH=107 /DNA_ID=CAMNT_0027837725 /DNA_START=105 /DNA_END=428 /DNA_ORIENTATION=-